jgi:hypothetical protein
MLPTCTQHDCPGHLGKFNSCEDEALYNLALEGADASTGSTDWHYHADLVIVSETTLVALDEITVSVPAGAYIVQEGTTGFVQVLAWDSPIEARTTFEAMDTEYAKFDNQDHELTIDYVGPDTLDTAHVAAFCSCGWRGDWHHFTETDQEQAEAWAVEDGDDHLASLD